MGAPSQVAPPGMPYLPYLLYSQYGVGAMLERPGS